MKCKVENCMNEERKKKQKKMNKMPNICLSSVQLCDIDFNWNERQCLPKKGRIVEHKESDQTMTDTNEATRMLS